MVNSGLLIKNIWTDPNSDFPEKIHASLYRDGILVFIGTLDLVFDRVKFELHRSEDRVFQKAD